MQQAIQAQGIAHQAYIEALKNETTAKQIVIHARKKYQDAKRAVDELHLDEVEACERNINLS